VEKPETLRPCVSEVPSYNFGERKVNEMSMPGFSAEHSIYEIRSRHWMATACDSQNSSTNVEPALPRICGVLHKMSWNAYFAGDYGLVEVLGHVMEGAGCFE